MITLYKLCRIHHHSHGAIFRIPTEYRGDVFMCITRAGQHDQRAVVEVDAELLLKLWRRPYSSHREIAIGNPDIWKNDYKFADAESGFSAGIDNPVPLAEVGCEMLDVQETIWKRHYLFWKRRHITGSRKESYLSFTNGITRTLWLLTYGAKVIPLECDLASAALLQDFAGIPGNRYRSVEELIPYE